MDQGLLPRRYAKALYKFAVEKDYANRAYELMEQLTNTFDSTPELEQTLANPYIADEKKSALLMTASTATSKDTPMADFFKLLEKNRRVDLSRQIALAYTSLYRRENNIYRVEVTSAQELSDSDIKRLQTMVDRHLAGASAQYEWNIDSSLIGGFTVTIDSQRLDASIKNELKQLRLNLLK